MTFYCYKCDKPLSKNENSYFCDACGRKWAEQDGVPIFTEPRYWGEISLEEMKKVLSFAETRDLDEVKSFLQANYPGAFRYSFDIGRADWRFYVPMEKTWRVLDVGCGMGGMMSAFPDDVAEIVGFDSSLERVKFRRLINEKKGVTNATVFVGDIVNPALPRESFDLVYMNGIVEWVGEADLSKDNRDVQIDVLKNCRALLKKNGWLYVGIENRFSLIYLLGGKDHSDLRFISFLPRPLANLYSKIARGKLYRNYIYGKRGYEKLLREAGFANIKFLLPLPGYNSPKYIIPYDNLAALEYAIKNLMSSNTWQKKLVKVFAGSKSFLKIYRYLFWSFDIIAQKND
jgi:SAM-dependent methyltransferase